VNEVPNQPAIRLHRLPGLFLKSFIFSVLTYAGTVALTMAAIGAVLPHGPSDTGWWQSLTRWSLTGFGLLAGVVGGGILGALSSAKKTMRMVETELHTIFQQLPVRSDEKNPTFSLNDGRARFTLLLDEALTKTVDRLPLPAFLNRLIRTKMQDAIVSDFIASLEQRGLSSIRPQEFRNWLLTKGVSLGLQPVYDQLAFWRYMIIGLLGLLLIGFIGIIYLT
jgi:hypothetical protein